MYYVSKTMEISASHQLYLGYTSPCESAHGHNWKIIVHCKSETLDENGMVIDFSHIKKVVHGRLDHKNLNNIGEFKKKNSTAENIAKWITEEVPFCYKAEVWESDGNYACYVEDDF